MKNIKKIPYSLKWDWRWLSQTNIPLKDRLAFIFRKYTALLTNRHSIRYLGTEIAYDNVNTPMTLESYPYEINLINREVDFSRECTILDIGANIGHFSITLGKLFPKCRIISFEANPEIYHYLENNTAGIPNVRIMNTAIGPQGKLPFYYLSGRSASGSFVRENIGSAGDDNNLRTLEIDVVELNGSNCQALDIPKVYDLIKIDVEGYEYQVIGSIHDIKARYLYIEYSNASARQCDYELIDLFHRIEKIFGRFSIIYCDRISPELSMGNMLVKCLEV